MESRVATSDFVRATTHLFSRLIRACALALESGPFCCGRAGVRTAMAKRRAIEYFTMSLPIDVDCETEM